MTRSADLAAAVCGPNYAPEAVTLIERALAEERREERERRARIARDGSPTRTEADMRESIAAAIRALPAEAASAVGRIGE